MNEIYRILMVLFCTIREKKSSRFFYDLTFSKVLFYSLQRRTWQWMAADAVRFFNHLSEGGCEENYDIVKSYEKKEMKSFQKLPSTDFFFFREIHLLEMRFLVRLNLNWNSYFVRYLNNSQRRGNVVLISKTAKARQIYQRFPQF